MMTPKSYPLVYFFLIVLILLIFRSVSFGLHGSIVGLWLFDGGSGNTASDLSNYGNDGKLKGGAEWTDGKFKKALSFNGKDAYVEVPSSDSLQIENEITIEFWLSPRNLTGDAWNILRKHTDDTYDYEIYADADGTIWFDLKIVEINTGIKIGSKSIPFKEWTHLAFTYDGKKGIMYLNGESVFEQDASGKIPTSKSPLFIGCRDSTKRFINGILDELCISDTARTVDEIKVHISKGIIASAVVENTGKLAVTWASLKR